MKSMLYWLMTAIVIGGFVSILASSNPDGFEKAGEEIGYMKHTVTIFKSVLPNYTIPGLSGWLSSSLAGILGVLLTFSIFWVLGKLLARKSQ